MTSDFDNIPETQPLQSVYYCNCHCFCYYCLQSVHSREVDEDEIEAEEALRERDERIRELEVVIMRQVGV